MYEYNGRSESDCRSGTLYCYKNRWYDTEIWDKYCMHEKILLKLTGKASAGMLQRYTLRNLREKCRQIDHIFFKYCWNEDMINLISSSIWERVGRLDTISEINMLMKRVKLCKIWESPRESAAGTRHASMRNDPDREGPAVGRGITFLIS